MIWARFQFYLLVHQWFWCFACCGTKPRFTSITCQSMRFHYLRSHEHWRLHVGPANLNTVCTSWKAKQKCFLSHHRIYSCRSVNSGFPYVVELHEQGQISDCVHNSILGGRLQQYRSAPSPKRIQVVVCVIDYRRHFILRHDDHFLCVPVLDILTTHILCRKGNLSKQAVTSKL